MATGWTQAAAGESSARHTRHVWSSDCGGVQTAEFSTWDPHQRDLASPWPSEVSYPKYC